MSRANRRTILDTSTEDALKAIITGIAATELTGGKLIDEIANSLAVSAAVSKEANDPVTAADLTRLARWARRDE